MYIHLDGWVEKSVNSNFAWKRCQFKFWFKKVSVQILLEEGVSSGAFFSIDFVVVPLQRTLAIVNSRDTCTLVCLLKTQFV